jgi:hypothetical protein
MLENRNASRELCVGPQGGTGPLERSLSEAGRMMSRVFVKKAVQTLPTDIGNKSKVPSITAAGYTITVAQNAPYRNFSK